MQNDVEYEYRTFRSANTGDDLRYIAGGCGDSQILFLHGFLSNAQMSWRKVMCALGNEYSYAATDYYGHGTTPSRGMNGSFETFCTSLGEFLDELHWEKALVVGHSMGGAIAQVFASVQPERVSGLVLSSSASRFVVMPGARLLRPSLDVVGRYARRVPEPLARTFARVAMCRSRVRSYPEYDAARFDWPGVVAALIELEGFDSRRWVGDIRVPVGTLLTRDDDVVAFRRQQELAGLVDPMHVTLTNLPHDASTTMPLQYARVLGDSISGLRLSHA